VAIDIVVVNFHTPDDLEQCIESLEMDPPKVDATLTIVEVDDEDYIHEFTWGGGLPGRTIGVAGNLGYARACNLATYDTENPIIGLFNADVVFRPGVIDACHGAMKENRRWGALGPRQVDERNLIRHAGIFGTFASPLHRGWNESDYGQYNDIRPAVTVSGSAYFVRRAAWREMTECDLYREIAPDALGAFLPTPHYYEETWLSYHLQAHHWAVTYFGAVSMIHKWHRASPIGGTADQQMEVSKAMFQAACEHHGIPHD
jgi:hypothetical protein